MVANLPANTARCRMVSREFRDLELKLVFSRRVRIPTINLSKGFFIDSTPSGGTEMSSPISFSGKCLTVLIGAGLSWMTITNPEVDQAVGRVLGMQRDTLDGTTEFDSVSTNSHTSSSLTNTSQAQDLPDVGSLVTEITASPSSSSPSLTSSSQYAASQIETPPHSATRAATRTVAIPVTSPTTNPATRIQEIANQLKSLGASYVLLERLPQAASDQYRARCDLAGDANSVKCCFEAVRSTPSDAMEDVLREVVSRRNGSANPSANSQVSGRLNSPPI